MPSPVAPALQAVLNVIVIDDHEAVRAGLRLVINSSERLHVAGAFSSGEEAAEARFPATPDVAVIDYRLAGRDGSWACAQLLRKWPSLAVLILTSFLDGQIVADCLRAGARGFLTKTASVAEVEDAILRSADGEAVLASEAVPLVLDLARGASRRVVGGDSLMPFHADILRCMSLGRSNGEIASSLGVSEDVVKTNIRSIKKRLGVAHRAQVVALAVKRGLV